jgi:hypothetical protein
VLKLNFDFGTLLIFVPGTKTPRKCYRIFFVRGRIRGCKIQCPAGGRGRGDPTGAAARQAPRTARGKRSDWSGNQQTNLTQPYFK